MSDKEWDKMLMDLLFEVCEDLKGKIGEEREFAKMVQEAVKAADMCFCSPCFWERTKSHVRPENMLEFARKIGEAISPVAKEAEYSLHEFIWALKIIILSVMVKSSLIRLTGNTNQGEIEGGCYIG